MAWSAESLPIDNTRQPISRRTARASKKVFDAAAEPKPCRAAAKPLAADLAAAGVVVLDAPADALDHVDAPLRLVEVVGGLVGRELPIESTFVLCSLSR